MSKKDNTLVKNASFLMVAALISKIIGMIYKSPLSAMLGNESFGCFQFAQNAYFILLMIASFSIPQAVSKIMAERIAFKRYRDAQRVFKGALLYAALAGGAVALFCVFGASIMVPDNMSNARLALQMLAPTIFISGLLGVFRGYFQAYRNMMPTSLSQIIEQIANACVALAMAGYMMRLFSDQGEDAAIRWGAAGATMGTGAGVSAAFLFMLFVYAVNRKTIRRKIERDRVSQNESYGRVMKIIVMIVMPIIFSAFIYNVNGYINSYMYSEFMGMKGLEKSTIQALYAEYGYYMTLINIPLTLASTAPTSMIPEVSAHYARNDIKEATEKTNKAAWISMLISIPAAVGLGVLAKPITALLFPATSGVAAHLMILGVVTIVLNGMSNISNGVLQGIGKPNIPMVNAAVSLAVDVVLLGVLLAFNNQGNYCVVIAQIEYYNVICVINYRAMKKYMDYKNPWKEAYLPPFLASIPMGIVAWLLYFGLDKVMPEKVLGSISVSIGICLVLTIAIAAAVYFIVYLFVAKPSRESLMGFPGSGIIIRLASRFHLLRD